MHDHFRGTDRAVSPRSLCVCWQYISNGVTSDLNVWLAGSPVGQVRRSRTHVIVHGRTAKCITYGCGRLIEKRNRRWENQLQHRDC